MTELVPIQMTTRDRAHWLADKVPQYNDYTAEAIAMLRRLADENERLQALADSGVSLARAVMTDQTGRG